MRAYRLNAYLAADGWRWRLLAPNGRIIADGAEAYSKRHGALRAARRLLQVFADNRVSISEE